MSCLLQLNVKYAASGVCWESKSVLACVVRAESPLTALDEISRHSPRGNKRCQVLHEAGDLTARNILIAGCTLQSQGGRVLSVEESSTSNLSSNSYWMSPELFRGETGITISSDVVSFRMIFCEVIRN